jgi:hypothetical protein
LDAPQRDASPDPTIKAKIWRDRICSRYAIYAAIDDRPDVLALWDQLGVPEVEAMRPLAAA